MIIHVNRQRIDWPKTIITEAQLRGYADADADDDIWQDNHVGGVTLIKGVANIYDGAQFYSRKRIL
jgi:hypothetical protein